MTLDPEDPDVRVAVFGRQVEDFLRTDIGIYLTKQAEHDAEVALQSLKNTAPWRTTKIRELQNRIKTAENFTNWMAEAIAAGQQATENLEDKHA